MRSIVRVDHGKDKPYLMVSKALLRDHSLKWAERGFLCFLLAKPDDWELRVDSLAKECGQSESTTYRLLNGLIRTGYARREIIVRRKAHAEFDSKSMYWVHEERIAAPKEVFELELMNVPF